MYEKNKFKRALIIGVFLLPGFLGLLLFKIISMISSLIVSFTDWSLLGSPKFVGLKNYIEIFNDPKFYESLKNTLYFIAGYLPLVLVFALIVATLLNKKLKGITIYRGIYFLPVITSWVAVSMIWKWLFNAQYGIINYALSLIGITGPAWLQDPAWVMPAIIITSAWKDIGFIAVIFLGGLQGISREYYESAEIDGANVIQKFLKITLPLLSPTTFYVLIITMINSFQVFDQVWVMTSGEPTANAIPVLVTEIYRNAFMYGRMGYATALSWVLFIIIFIVTIIQNVLQKRWVNYD